MKRKSWIVVWVTLLVTLWSFSAHAGWVTTSAGKKYKASSSSEYVTGWQTIDGSKYYFTSSGIMVTGKYKIGKITYYFKSNGKLRTGLVKIGNYYYFLGNEGYKHSGMVTIKKNGKSYRYYFQKKNGRMVTGKATINGTQYYFKKNGQGLTGWLKSNGKYYYYKSGAQIKGHWISSGGKKYYVETKEGYRVTGLRKINGKLYYFYNPSGELATNIKLYVGSKQYSIGEDGVATGGTKLSVSGSTKGSKIAKYAIQYVGNPYVYGGTSLTNGADCSGFVYTVFRNNGITNIPRVADDQMKSSYGTRFYNKDNLLPGDLVFYGSGNYASHVAIYIGDGQVVHASNSQPYPQGGIKISEYDYRTPIAYVRYWS